MPKEEQAQNESLPLHRRLLWDRLDQLLQKIRNMGLKSLGEQELDEFGKLYRACSTHLAMLRSFGASSVQLDRLNSLVTQSHAIIYGEGITKPDRRRWISVFLSFPESVRRSLRYHALAFLMLLLGCIYGYWGVNQNPEWGLIFLYPGDTRSPYANREELLASILAGRDEDPRWKELQSQASASPDIDSGEKAIFAAQLWQNNTRVALVAFFSGFLLCIPPLLLMLYTGTQLGVYTHTFLSHGLGLEWFAWVLPHGVTELLAANLLAGAGLWMGKTLFLPGNLTRMEALRAIRADIFRLLFFAFPMMFFAALIESFLRQSNLSDTIRYAFALFSALFWIVYLGWTRLPQSWVVREESRKTQAERIVPLPSDEEFLGLLQSRTQPNLKKSPDQGP